MPLSCRQIVDSSKINILEGVKMSLLTFDELNKRLKKYNQQHLLQFWNELNRMTTTLEK